MYFKILNSEGQDLLRNKLTKTDGFETITNRKDISFRILCNNIELEVDDVRVQNGNPNKPWGEIYLLTDLAKHYKAPPTVGDTGIATIKFSLPSVFNDNRVATIEAHWVVKETKDKKQKLAISEKNYMDGELCEFPYSIAYTVK